MKHSKSAQLGRSTSHPATAATLGQKSARPLRLTLRLKLRIPALPRPLQPLQSIYGKFQARLPFLREVRVRSGIVATTAVIILAEVLSVIQPYFLPHSYALGAADSLLAPTNQVMADELKYNSTQQAFTFNDGSTPPASGLMTSAGTQVSALAYQDASKGITVTDPVNKINFSLKPKFGLWQGRQQGNRVVYPLDNGSGWAVYSMHSIGVKEDILLTRSRHNTMTFDYSLGLSTSLQARIEKNGSVGIYGNKLFSSTITTGNSKDAALLQKARANAPKNTLLFTIPAPVITQLDKKHPSATAAYSLHGNDLKVTVTGLSHAHYPLTIDPSIYVATAQQFMNGNNDTNIDFNVADKLIEKGKTTGARFNSWNSTRSLNTSVWQQGVAAAGGFIYTVGGNFPNGLTTTFNTQGSATYTVPSGYSSITVKMWGGGGGGGGGGNGFKGTGTSGGAGGGGGYILSTLAVTPGETLNIYVGGGGNGGLGNYNRSGGGGGSGGGYSDVTRGTTPLAIAAGGAGGGGGDAGTSGFNGGAGGAGGGTSGVAGGASNTAGGGGGATQAAGGSAGSGGSNTGTAGSSLTGGAGADGRSAQGADGSGVTGGSLGGGNGGSVPSSGYAGAGGGGGGYFGGGGGSGSSGSGTGGAGGGGGGSSYTSGSNVTNTAGSGSSPGNTSDSARNGAGDGGSGGALTASGTNGSNGLVIITAGTGSTNTSSVTWAQFNTSTGSIDSPNPGSGTCGGWCTTSAYSLPAARSNLALTAYNGFLYAIGGEDSSCTSTNGTGDNGICQTVYIAKLGANGEPQLWSPSSTDKTTWTYWYRDTNLTSPRSMIAAVVYNNRMYLLGGKTSASGTVSIANTAQVADLTATGKLGSWSSQTALPYADYGYGAQVYNDRIYLIGGASSVGGTPLSSVYYNKISSNGTLNSWVQTSSLTNGRMTEGGDFSSSWGGYIYVSGGCTGVNGNGFCTSVAADTQLASINTDGSLDTWSTISGVSDTRMGENIVAWRNYIYEIGGCSAQNTSSGVCTTALNTINYGAVNQDGDISTITRSVASGTSPCSGSNPYNCDLPPTSSIGQMLNATAIINGYLYVAGGCTNASCTSFSKNTAYAAISSTGALTVPANCTADGNTLSGSWCIDTTHTLNPGNQGANNTGVGAAGTAVFNNTIYFVGGIVGAGLTGQIYYVTVNTDGSLTSSWSYVALSSVGATAVAYDVAYARANPAAASTAPGNLYIFGGCTAVSGAACTTYTSAVYKCDIQTSATVANCSTTNQLQIGTVAGASGAGLADMGATVYANYIYLIGGAAPGMSALDTVYYAKIDNTNNVVAASGSSWALSSSHMPTASAYAAAYGYNGYLYVVGGYNSTNGVLGSVEFAEINVSDGSIGTFATSSATITPSWGMGVPVSNSYAYVLGGCGAGAPPSSCSTLQATVQNFKIYNNDSGAPAGYTTASNTYAASPNRLGTSSAILNGYLYVAGGCTSTTDCSTAVSNVSYAAIDANGNIGSWSSTTMPLPAVRTWGKLEAAGGSLYYMGGQSSTSTDVRTEVYYATPSSGNISSWGTATYGLPAARTQFGAAVWNNRLYVVGGLNSTSATTNTVYISPQLTTGGNITAAWSTTSSSLNVARSGLTIIAYSNNLYAFGGYDGTNYLSDSQYAQINTSDGSVGSWAYSTSLPAPLAQGDGFAANGYIYLIGGRSSASSCSPVTLEAPISANTTIASGNHPTGIGQWSQTSQSYTGARYGNAAVYSNGKAYVLGGACGATLTYASPATQQTTLLSQPQVAKYSIMIDTDSDVYPNAWLLNGLDNSIGAKWQLKYVSMTDPYAAGPDGVLGTSDDGTSCSSSQMTTWGQTTNFGDVALGTPGIYTPKDASGNTTNCARYFYFNVTVDSSQAFGYPDDVSRGPTITDLTLQFTADPSKRLMHGRTFTGGLQQPDDTPYYTY